jgi:hypothetical protein
MGIKIHLEKLWQKIISSYLFIFGIVFGRCNFPLIKMAVAPLSFKYQDIDCKPPIYDENPGQS